MTPRIFLESGPLWAVGLAVARRCVLRLGFGDIYPNLYYLWVATTTYYHKSTGLNAITDMVRDTMPPDEFALHDLEEPVKHPAINATMDQAVFDLFNAYYAALHDMTDPRRNLDDRLRGNYGRFSTMALKLALILAIMDWADQGMQQMPRITTAHWARGQMLAEEYRASVHRLLDELSIGKDVKNEKKVLDFIARHRERPPSTRDILRDAGSPDRRWGDRDCRAQNRRAQRTGLPGHTRRTFVMTVLTKVETSDF